MTPMSDIAKAKRLNLISLFTGAGGLDLGLESAGFAVRACVEVDPDRCKTLELNRPSWRIIQRDIREVTTREILRVAGLRVGEPDLVSAGPPCQPFSKSAFWARADRDFLRKDARVALLMECARIIREAKPKAYLIENVPGLAYKTARSALEELIGAIKQAGYSCNLSLLNAADYGVPQKRQRLFMTGTRDGGKIDLRKALSAMRETKTAGEAIRALDDGLVQEGENIGGKWVVLLPLIPPGGNYLDLTAQRGCATPIFRSRSKYWSFLLKLSPDKPSWTVQASPGPYTGPFHWNNRKLRIPELKRLQTYPDEWKFYGSAQAVRAQIGNAVPPLLAWKIGKCLAEHLGRLVPHDEAIKANCPPLIAKKEAASH